MVRSMETPQTGVDVNPITRQLARRLQQRSILYLIGPGRVLDRVGVLGVDDHQRVEGLQRGHVLLQLVRVQVRELVHTGIH